MWKPARRVGIPGRAVGLLLLGIAAGSAPGPVLAQVGPIDAPNPMAAHTLFIILITGAFLAWAASFSVHLSRERKGRQIRQELLHRREAVLDEIAQVELARESGALADDAYKRRIRDLRGELARVVERLNPNARNRRPKT